MKNCTCDRALLPPAGGSLPQRTAQRDAVRCWVLFHLRKFPEAWLTPVELCRVLAEQYACEKFTQRSGFSGRLATVKRVLAELEEAGDVVASASRHRWRASTPAAQPPGRVALMTARIARHRRLHPAAAIIRPRNERST